MIDRLSVCKFSKNATLKSDYMAIKKWVVNAWETEGKNNNSKPTQSQTSRALTPAEIKKKYEEEYGIKGDRV